MTIAAGLALADGLVHARVPALAFGVGLAGAFGLGVGLVLRRPLPASVGLALVGAGYALSLAGRGVDPAVGLVAGAFLLTAELTYWALEPVYGEGADARLIVRRALIVASLALGSAMLGTLLLELAGSAVRGGAALEAAGVVAVVGALGLAVALVQALRRRPPLG